MNILQYCLLFFLVLFNPVVYCSMISAERWKFNQENNHPFAYAKLATIILVYDYHKVSKKNCQQVKDLLRYPRVKSNKVSLIVEDPDTFNDNKLSWKQLSTSVERYDAPIRNLVSLAHHSGILATSAEFRPTTTIPSSDLSIADEVKATNDQVEAITKYDDGSLLNGEYKKYVERYDKVIAPNSKQLFENIKAQNCSLKDINYDLLEYPEEANRVIHLYEPSFDVESCSLKERVKKVITHSAQEAINCKMLHALADHAKKGSDIVIIYGGGGHLDALKPILEKLGCYFDGYPTINYNKDGEIQPLNVAQALQELDPDYDPDTPLPTETIDLFFAFKELEEKRPSFTNRSLLKMFVTVADSLCNYRFWKQEHPRLGSIISGSVSVAGVCAVLWCIIRGCCQSR